MIQECIMLETRSTPAYSKFTATVLNRTMIATKLKLNAHNTRWNGQEKRTEIVRALKS